MRYQPTHAAPRGSVPFMLRGPKSLRTVLNAAVAGAIGLTPAIMLVTPAQAVIADYTFEDLTVTVNEGSSMQFTLNRAASATAETLTWNLVGGLTNAATEEDFTPASGTVTFNANETSKTITVSTTNDSMDENNENVVLRVIDAVPNSTPLEATGTINDNDNAPGYKLVFDDASPDEGIGSVTVTAELDGPSGKAVTIPISTKNGTARFGQDYTALAANSSLTVAPGETTSDSQTITITDDLLYEDKQQDLQVVGGANASVSGTQSGTVTIVDNEDQPTITVDEDSAAEGSPLSFDVGLSGAAEKEVTASYTTVDGPGADMDAADAAQDGTATAGVDYTAITTGTVRFPAGDTTQSITVNTRLDQIDETDDENMHVKLASPTVAKLGEVSEATGSITDDDAPPTVTINPAPTAFNEGNTGRTTKTYTVRLERASGKKVSVDYSTLAGTARDGEDYAAVSGTLTFNPGDTTKTISVDVVGDTMYENNETFQIDLDSNDATAPAPYTVTITDDDNRPTLSIAPMSMPEGSAGSVAVFPIKLSNPADEDITIDVSATGGTASVFAANAAPGQTDFWAPNSSTVIPAGQTTGYVYFLVNGDDVFEGNEQMTVGVAPAALSVATGGAKTATLTLTNDDAAPTLNVVNAGGSEGDEVQLRGLVTGIAQDAIQLNVNLRGAAANGSPAASAGDFTDPGTLAVTIAGGTYPGSSQDIGLVRLTDDTVAEPAETIQVSGNGFGAGTVNDGWLTIAASDGYTPPTNPGPTNPGPSNPGPTNPGPTNPGPSNPGPSNPGPSNPGPTNPGPTNPPAKVTQRPTLTGGSLSAGTATLTVTSNPSTPKAKFIIQRQNANGSWTSVLTSNLMSTGTYKATLRNQPAGTTVNYRAYVYGTDTTTPAYSPIKRVGIRR